MAPRKKSRRKPSKRRPILHSVRAGRSSGAANPADVASIEAVLKALYEGISFSKGAEPDWNRLRSLFYPGATLTHVKADKTDVQNIEGFIRSGRTIIRSGKPLSFYESEVSRKIEQYGRIAQVFSTYESRFYPAGVQPLSRGINSIQLLKENGRWWVLSIFWADEFSEGPIPERYLAAKTEPVESP